MSQKSSLIQFPKSVSQALAAGNVVRGTIRPEAFLGGAMTIDSEAARRAFVDLAKSLNLSVQEAATSAIELATANIVRAIQLISTERGRDPRDYVLVGYGGAGPLHACEVAESLGIGRVLVPPFAGVLSAFGLLASDYRQYDTLTRRFQVDETSPEVIDEVYRELRGRAAGRFAALGIDEAAPDYSLTLEMRHVGQAFEVAVELPPEGLSKLTGEELREAFSQVHLRAYSYPATPGKAVEVVSFRLGAVVKTDRLPRIRPQRANGQDPRRSYDLHLRGRTIACVGTTRTGLGADETLAGPAIVDDVSSTIFVPEGWAARLVAGASLEILREDRAK
ncbi:MAG: hydantoinase/oxoprolinase family protein [Kiloniellales bacterium]|nr:hydantoinase/oxoprolinase family protein [Kiloniellales bacterium]